MRAIVYTGAGGNEVVSLEERATPAPVGRRRSRRRPLRGAQPRRHRAAERPLSRSSRLTAGRPRHRGLGDGDRLRPDRAEVRSGRPGLRTRRRRRARRPRARARAPRHGRAGAARRARRGRRARGVRDGARCRDEPGRRFARASCSSSTARTAASAPRPCRSRRRPEPACSRRCARRSCAKPSPHSGRR